MKLVLKCDVCPDGRLQALAHADVPAGGWYPEALTHLTDVAGTGSAGTGGAYHDAGRWLTWAAHCDGYVTLTACDAAGDVTSICTYYPNGVTLASTTTFGHDADGNRTCQTTGDRDLSTYRYDPGRNQTSATARAGTGAAAALTNSGDGDHNVTVTAFDALGNPRSLKVYDPGGVTLLFSINYEPDPDRNVPLDDLDSSGDVTEAEGAASSVPPPTTSQYDRDGNVTEEVAADGTITRTTYDAAGNTLAVKVYEPDGVTLLSAVYYDHGCAAGPTLEFDDDEDEDEADYGFDPL